MVPNGWTKIKLGDHVEFRNGVNADKDQYGEGVKFVNVMDVFNNDILTESKIIGRITLSDKQLKDNTLHYGDILFNRTSETFNEIAMSAVYLDEADATFGGFVIRGRPKTDILDPMFAVYSFQDTGFRRQVIRLGQGAIRANIGQKDLSKVTLLVPPLPEQQKIAKILTTWDKAIDVTERLIAKSQQQKKALMQQLMTGKKRLLDKNGKPFESDWETGTLGDLAILTSGYAFKSNDVVEGNENSYPIIRMSDLKDGALNLNKAVRVHEDTTVGLENYKLSEDDFVFGMSGSLDNYATVRAYDLPCYLNQRVGRIRAKSNADQTFVSYLYLSDKVRWNILSKAAGAAQLNISINELRRTKVNSPSKEEQQKIAAVLTNADKEIDLLEQQLADLQQEKKALMQMLLTGKKRVLVD